LPLPLFFTVSNYTSHSQKLHLRDRRDFFCDTGSTTNVRLKFFKRTLSDNRSFDTALCDIYIFSHILQGTSLCDVSPLHHALVVLKCNFTVLIPIAEPSPLIAAYNRCFNSDVEFPLRRMTHIYPSSFSA
jgi:hypothetical protein